MAQENYPVEFLELSYPVRLTTYGIHCDSGGPGAYRGGCGIVREYEVLADDAVLAVRMDGVTNPPWGAAGGSSGGPPRAVVNPGTPDERVLAPLSDGNHLRRGDILRIETGGGGGRGDPFNRDPDLVQRDVEEGYVLVEAARRRYGVVIRDGAVDGAATAAARARLALPNRMGRADALA